MIKKLLSKKKVIALLMVLCLFGGYITIKANQQATSKQTITINNTTLEFNNIVFLSPNGDDAEGDGTKEKPYKTYHQVYKNSTTGDCIFFMPGEYVLNQVVYSSKDGSGNDVLNINNRAVIGCNEKTVLHIDTTQLSGRDTPIVCAMDTSEETYLGNLHIKFTQRKGYNYSNALFKWLFGTVNNVYFERIDGDDIAYSYNNHRDAYPKINNCAFSIGSSRYSDYSGTPVYTNCLFSILPYNGSKTTSLTREITSADLSASIPDDLAHVGTGTNPDGSIANIGVYGGEFAWGGTIKVNDEVIVETTPESTQEPGTTTKPETTAKPETTQKPTENQLSILLGEGEQQQLSLSYDLDKNQSYQWKSSDNSVVMVDENGIVTGFDDGQAQIKVQSEDGTYKESIHIKVISDKKVAAHVLVGNTVRLYLVDDYTAVKWSSSNETIATVDNTGLVAGVKKGLVLIKGEIGNKVFEIYVRIDS